MLTSDAGGAREGGGESMRREVKAGEDSSLRSGILHFVQNDSFASE